MADQNPSDSPSSIESDLPISEVVTALKSASQTPIPSAPAATTAPILTEVKTEIPVVSPQVPAAPKGPLYEDPDLVKVPGSS